MSRDLTESLRGLVAPTLCYTLTSQHTILVSLRDLTVYFTTGRLTFILTGKQNVSLKWWVGRRSVTVLASIKIFELIILLLHNMFHRGQLLCYGLGTTVRAAVRVCAAL